MQSCMSLETDRIAMLRVALRRISVQHSDSPAAAIASKALEEDDRARASALGDEYVAADEQAYDAIARRLLGKP